MYPFPWEQVIIAFWNKYPNVLQPHVRRVDIINFDFDKKSNTLYTKRLFSLKYGSPKLLERIIGSSLFGFAIEETVTDFNNRNHVSNGTNYSFKNTFIMKEICSFQPSKDNLESTLYTQKFTLQLNRKKDKPSWINKLFENVAIQSFNEKSASGIKAMHLKIDQNKHLFNQENEIKKGHHESSKSYVKDKCLRHIIQKKSLAFFGQIKNLLFSSYKRFLACSDNK